MTLSEAAAPFSAFCFVAACVFALWCGKKALRREVLPAAASASALLAVSAALILLLPLEERYFPGPSFFTVLWLYDGHNSACLLGKILREHLLVFSLYVQ